MTVSKKFGESGTFTPSPRFDGMRVSRGGLSPGGGMDGSLGSSMGSSHGKLHLTAADVLNTNTQPGKGTTSLVFHAKRNGPTDHLPPAMREHIPFDVRDPPREIEAHAEVPAALRPPLQEPVEYPIRRRRRVHEHVKGDAMDYAQFRQSMREHEQQSTAVGSSLQLGPRALRNRAFERSQRMNGGLSPIRGPNEHSQATPTTVQYSASAVARPDPNLVYQPRPAWRVLKTDRHPSASRPRRPMTCN